MSNILLGSTGAPQRTEFVPSLHEMYMDTIAEGCMDNITRLVSSTPNHEEWALGICKSLFESLFAIKGSYNGYIRKRFTEICIRGTFVLPKYDKSTIFLRTHTTACSFMELVGGNLLTLRWEEKVSVVQALPLLIASAQLNCPNLRNFVFPEHFSSQMETLQMPSSISINEVRHLVLHRPALSALILKEVKCTSLQGQGLWKILGDSLKCLVIHMADENRTDRISAEIVSWKDGPYARVTRK